MTFPRTSLLTIIVLAISLSAQAQVDLSSWREDVKKARQLADNDVLLAAQKAEQLWHELPKKISPGDRVQMLNVLARIELYQGHAAQAAQHAEAALTLARQQKDRVGHIEADLCIALIAFNQSRFDRAKEATEDSMQVLQGVVRPELLAEAMLRTAVMYLRYGHVDKALMIAMQNLETVGMSDQPLAMAYAHQAAAIVFDQTGRKAEAREHYRQMRNYAQAAHSRLLEAEALSGLGAVLAELGSVELGEHLLSEAIDEIYRKTGAPLYLAQALLLQAELQRRQQKYQDALDTLDESIRIYSRHEHKVGLWQSLQAQGTLWLSMQNLEQAQSSADRAYSLAREIGMTVYLAESNSRLAELAARRGHYRVAYRYAAEAEEWSAKQHQEVTSSRILELAQQYETESKQRRIDELTQHAEQERTRHRWLWSVLAGLLILLVPTAYFLVRLRKSREEIRMLNAGLEQRVQARTTELLESRASLAEAQRIAHLGSWEMDLVENVLTWSDEIYRIFEISPAEFDESYEAFLAAVHPDDRERVDQLYKSALEQRTHFELDHRLLFPDGRIKYVHERCETLYAEDGKALRSIGTVQDITERMESDLKLKEALEFSEGVINAIPDLLFELNGEGRYLNVWTHTSELLQTHKEVLLGKRVSELLMPESTGTVMCAIREAEENGVSFGNIIMIELPRGKGWFELSVSKKAGGTYLMLARDVTGRMQMESALRDSHNFLLSLIDAVPDPIFVKDREHRLILLNEANFKFTGLPRESLIGKTDYDVYAKEEADRRWAEDERVFDSGEVMLAEERFISSDGEEHFIQTKKTPFTSADGNKMLVGVIRDITVQKRFESAREAALAEAVKLAKMRSDFLSRMSHELRTPLNGILGYVQLLHRSGKLAGSDAEALDVIHQSGEYLLSLIDDILDLARIDAGRFQLEVTDIALPNFLRVVCDIMRVHARERGVGFNCYMSADIPLGVRGDEKRLRQVLLNLLTNAIKFTPQGKVELHVERKQPGSYTFLVRDTGVGIPASDLERIFQPFEQALVSVRAEGSGLGLSICRELVRMMGGEIMVVSREGEGSIFSFELELPEIELRNVPKEPDEHRTSELAAYVMPALKLPPRDMLLELLELARVGNMREIIIFAERVVEHSADLRPFADHLCELADAFQSKRILTLVESYLNDASA